MEFFHETDRESWDEFVAILRSEGEAYFAITPGKAGPDAIRFLINLVREHCKHSGIERIKIDEPEALGVHEDGEPIASYRVTISGPETFPWESETY